ncbi:MAG: hypothetical protein P8107_13445, partial [Spirochaetia bacterium]
VMKKRLSGLLPRYLEELNGSIQTEDAFERVRRISGLFAQIPEWEDEETIARDSLLREFIGGSMYQY